MSRLLIIFGDNTADEIHAVAAEFYSGEFDQISKAYFSPDSNPDEIANEYSGAFSEVFFCIGVVEDRLRKRIQEVALKNNFKPFSIVHPSASIANSAQIGNGCFIAPQSIVSVRAVVGDYSILHFHSSVGHDAKLGMNVTVLPGARVSGEVQLGDFVLVGSNAFIFQGVKIGAGTQIDALTYVRHDVPTNMVISCRAKPPLNNPFPRLDRLP